MGRNPLPHAVQDAKGYYLKHPKAERKELQVDRPLGPPPAHLDHEHKKVWREISKPLPPGGAKVTDRQMFEALVRGRGQDAERYGQGNRHQSAYYPMLALRSVSYREDEGFHRRGTAQGRDGRVSAQTQAEEAAVRGRTGYRGNLVMPLVSPRCGERPCSILQRAS